MNHDKGTSGVGTVGNTLRRITRKVAEAFGIFDDALNLDKRERDLAHARYGEVKDCLLAAGVAVDAFLQGSFARKTMLKPLKDVDVVVLLPASLRHLLGTANGPATAMALLRVPLEARFPGVAFDVDDAPDKALRVTFADLSFTFDLVVAFDSAPGDEKVLLGNRETSAWEPSNTRILRRLIETRNVVTGGTWVHQARMFKNSKKDDPVLAELCGLLYESLLYAAIRTRMTHPKALATVLAHASVAVRGPVYDPTLEEDLTADWTQAQRSSIVAAIEAAAKQAQEALILADDGEEIAAVGVWHDILGDPFPVPPTPSVDDTFRALGGGSITSTGVAVTSTRGRQTVRPARPWRSS